MNRDDPLTPLFAANTPFNREDAERWRSYCDWAKITSLKREVLTLDTILCPQLPRRLIDEDWAHIVNADHRLDHFYDLNYLLGRVRDAPRKNIFGLYRNPVNHISQSPADGFVFVGYDLIEEQTQVSALTNCGGFPDVFSND